jgi:lipopolysaccharide export system protein LptA
MSEDHRKNPGNLELRTRVPAILRVVAAVGAVAVLIVLAIGIYRARSVPEFRMKGFPTSLSKDVVAVVDGYERTETDGGIRNYVLRAERATTFADNHQELENVYAEVFDASGSVADRITALKAVYVPDGDKNFTAYFAGNVNIETRDALRIRTEQVTYRREAEIAEAEESVEFDRGNVSGRAVGAIVRIGEKRLELLRNVEIDAVGGGPEDELGGAGIKGARITSERATVDQTAEKIELFGNVFVGIVPNGADPAAQPTEIRSERATVGFAGKDVRSVELTGAVDVYRKPVAPNTAWSRARSETALAGIDGDVKRLELHGSVAIETAGNGAGPTRIECASAVYERDSDRFDLRDNVRIATLRAGRQTNIAAANAVYEQTAGRIALSGGASVENGRDRVTGDRIDALLWPDRALRETAATGNSSVTQSTPERVTEVRADRVNAYFAEDGLIRSANTVGPSRAELVPAEGRDYSKITLSAPRALRVAFASGGLLDEMSTDGRTTVVMGAAGGRDASVKTLTADSVKTFFGNNGKDLSRAEATGNAELVVEPVSPSLEEYRTQVNASRFDCDFYPSSSNVRECVARSRTRTVRTPTFPAPDRGVQTITGETLTAAFGAASRDVEQLTAAGSAKFTELDRSATAERIVYATRERTVRLRGGEPTAWDSRARARADEIDWNVGTKRSYLRGQVSTAYYNQKQTNGATPFVESNKPVYITAANAEFDHSGETADYTGNARAWQDSNYVRADRIIIRQREGQMTADGAVQSVLYDVRSADRKDVPAFASSRRMTYSREARVLRYEESVDIRQGTDRVTAGTATIKLNEANEMSQTTVEKDVVITQPKRRATGSWAQYTNDIDVAVLRGDPATVEDAETGTTQGAQLTFSKRENRITNEAKSSPQNSGRIRSVYRVKKN